MESPVKEKAERLTPWNDPPRRARDLSALYSTPSQHSVAERDSKELEEILPGPGHFFGPDSKSFNSIGPDFLSHRRAAPIVTIAKTGWNNWAEAMITRKHQDRKGMGPDPGLYEAALSTLSRKGISVARETRFSKKAQVTASPGPVYDVREHHCKDGNTDIVGNFASRFPHDSRFKSSASDCNLAPGQYNRKDDAICMHRGRSFGIGWKAYDKVIRPGWELEGQGKTGPGVGPPLWEEVEDFPTKHLIPKAQRFRANGAAFIPGPGAYPRNERDVSKLKSALSDTRNPRNAIFGKPGRKPRLRLNVLSSLNGAKDGNWGY